MTRSRSTLLVTLVVPLCACQGPVGVKAPPGESSSSDGGAAASSTTLGAATSSGGEPDPSRPPPPPFELPDGCGDGVIVPGQFDCFFPVSIDWVEEELGGNFHLYPLDLEDDGRDEMVAVRGGRSIAVLRWQEDELQLGPVIDSGLGSAAKVETRWDWNGDGRHDVAMFWWGHPGRVVVHLSQGANGLGEQILEHELPPLAQAPGPHGNTGFVAPIDVNGSRKPELLLSMQVDGLGNANPIEDLVLFRQMSTTWEAVGPAHRWGPCGWLEAVAHGDFDADGDEDIAVLDHGQACDPYPSGYDPEWYRVWVLLANAEDGVLELGGSYPTGGAVDDPAIWAEDVTRDGRLDLVLRISEHAPCDSGSCIYSSLAVMRGVGDGSFEEGKRVDLGPSWASYKVDALIDVDGDGAREWIIRSHERPWAIPFDLSQGGVAPMAALNDPGVGGSTRFQEPTGDVNGDGIDDYTVASSVEDSVSRYTGDYLMISEP